MKHLLTIVAVVTLLSACSGDRTVDDALTHHLYDIVTYTGSDKDTGIASFERVERDNRSTTMLSGWVPVPEGIKPQQRVLLRYNYDDEAVGASSRNVKVYGITGVITDSLRVGKVALSYYAMHPVKMRSAWRTGDFINMHCQVEYTGKSRTFMLLIDDATRNCDTVHCYLHHDLRTDTAYQWRECYASFNVGNVWKRTACHTLRVHINDEITAGERCYDFDR